MKRTLFTASDYAELGNKNGLSFYYGYERTICPVHGKDNKICHSWDCDKAEWAFVVSKGKEEIWSCGADTLKRCYPDLILNSLNGPESHLLAGIGLWLEITK